ncbi:MAG: hypothetical protein IH586_07410 [Anaerolineaceae bacterium]|nr:hypothetical protein [Anaerolineaceae bacterium]
MKLIVRQWVIEVASQTPGFLGAFFHGSINWLAEEDCLPSTSDVDVMIVLDGPTPPEKLGKLLYRGVIIEASYLPAEQIHSADQVLGLSHLAGSLQTDSIIADPTGRLRRVQAEISKDYAKREWVTRRCEQALRKVQRHLEGLNEAVPFQTGLFHDQVTPWLFGTGVTTHILLVAGLKNPTVRKRYLAVRELLAEYGREDFYPPLLELLGCARMSQAQAEQHLAGLETVFDAAQAVIRTPFSFAADISQLARPVVIDGSRELIKRGDQREAVFWMAVTYSRCQQVLTQDGPPGMAERYDPAYRALVADLGIRSFADLQQRSQQVREMLPRIWEVAQAIMAANPEIIN